ncbi:MAG TPA: hypothetical protein VF516_38840 [Kofleriaceae bacterium]
MAGCHPGDDTAAIVQAVGPPAPEVMTDADTVLKYATACGLGDTPDMDLPDLGDKTTPIRGTTDATQVGKLTKKGWTLVQHFDADTAHLASGAHLKANLWHKQKGGRDWYYLYRYDDPDPTVKQENANGILGFDATSICAFDKLAPAATPALPPASISDLYFAGQFDNNPAKMDDCSDCHLAGYNAPRPKTLAVAKGDNGKMPWLKIKWLPQWMKFTNAYGPVWKLGKATKTDKWTSGDGMALVTPPADCSDCHKKWIPVRNRDDGAYCDTVFAKAFDGNGSMTKQKSTFGDNATCTTFITDIGCGPGRPGGAADLRTLCPPAKPPAPMVSDGRMMIQGIQVVSSTAVNIVPAQDSTVTWDLGSVFAFGDAWVTSIQVWGGPYPGSTTFPMSPVINVPAPDVLPSFIQVTGLAPGQSYQFQLRVTDSDGAIGFEPLTMVTMPLDGNGSGSGSGGGSDAGVDSGSGSDAGAGSGSGSGSGVG